MGVRGWVRSPGARRPGAKGGGARRAEGREGGGLRIDLRAVTTTPPPHTCPCPRSHSSLPNCPPIPPPTLPFQGHLFSLLEVRPQTLESNCPLLTPPTSLPDRQHGAHRDRQQSASSEPPTRRPGTRPRTAVSGIGQPPAIVPMRRPSTGGCAEKSRSTSLPHEDHASTRVEGVRDKIIWLGGQGVNRVRGRVARKRTTRKPGVPYTAPRTVRTRSTSSAHASVACGVHATRASAVL